MGDIKVSQDVSWSALLIERAVVDVVKPEIDRLIAEGYEIITLRGTKIVRDEDEHDG